MSLSESSNLTEDGMPFGADTYFSSPELSQRADLLRHLTENSHLIPLIRGVEGIGKSTFIQHLLGLAPENWIPVEVKADVMMQPDTLLANLAEMFERDYRSDRLMDELIMHFDDLRHNGFLPVIIVDDAHLLPEASIITLLRLHERGSNDVPLAQILLFAEPEIDDLLKTPQLRVMNLQTLQLLDMPKFTLEQTERYLGHLFAAEEATIIKPISTSQIERIHHDADGLPGLIKQQAQQFIGSTKEVSHGSDLRGFLSSGTFIGGGLALFIVALILIYQGEINAIFTGESEMPALSHEEKILADESVPLAIPSAEENAGPVQETVSEEPVGQVVPGGDIGESEGAEVDLGSVSEEEEDKYDELSAGPQEKAAPTESGPVKPEDISAPAVQTEETPQPGEAHKAVEGDKAVPEKKTPPESSPAKKENAPQKQEATAVAEKKKQTEKEPTQAGVIKTGAVAPVKTETKRPEEVKQKLSETGNKKINIKAQETQVPDKSQEAKKDMPAPQDVATVKVPAPAAKAPAGQEKAVQSVPEKDGLPTPAPVEDRSTMLVTKEVSTVKATDSTPVKVPDQQDIDTKPTTGKHETTSGGYLREEWLLKQSPSSFTIQIVGLHEEKGITGFLRRHSVQGQVAYYRTRLKDKPWFPVLYGVYPTRGKAIEARDKLPKTLLESGVWVRTIGSVQKEIKAR